VKAISLHQPHASFIALGLKPFETRGWATAYRGPLLIHAAQRKMDRDALALLDEIYGAAILEGMPGGKEPLPLHEELPLGAFVCIVDLVDCMDAPSMPQSKFDRSNGLGDFGMGRFAWELANVRRFITPIPALGRQRFWNFPTSWVEHQLQPMELITL
jgi:hypothetical protein